MEKILQAILEHGATKGARSTILHPLHWALVICLPTTVYTASKTPDSWLNYLFGIFTALAMVLYIATYIYCLFTDKDALRSEKFVIQKLAITKSFVGDDMVGVIDTSEAKLKQVGQSTAAIDVAMEVDK